MPRGKAKAKPQKSKLLQALQFLSVCQADKGANDAQMFCSIQQKGAVAFDGVIAAGIAIDEDLDACPHTQEMILALSRCGESFQIVQLSPETLKISSGSFQAFVPCCQRERLTAVNPEAGIIPVSAGLSAAIQIVAPLASEKANILEAVSIQLNVNSVIATNRKMVMEAWHGSNLPFGSFLLPKAAATALGKIKKEIVSIGIKPNLAALFPAGKDENLHNTLTFWFDDGSWMRTQLHKGKWREDASKLLRLPSKTARPIKAEFFETVAKVLPFSDDGKLYCKESSIASHWQSYEGAGYSLPVDDGPTNKIYDGKNLMLAGKYALTIDEDQGPNFTLFFGSTIRCAVWHDILTGGDEIADEDIPF